MDNEKQSDVPSEDRLALIAEILRYLRRANMDNLEGYRDAILRNYPELRDDFQGWDKVDVKQLFDARHNPPSRSISL